MPKKITIRGIIGLSDKATPEHMEDSLAEAGSGDISVTFASPGGFVSSGIEMSNMIRAHVGRTTAIITGQAASMASYMPMMFDHVIAYDNTVFMIHNPMGGVLGADYRAGTAFSEHMLGLRDLFSIAYANKSGKSVAEINKMMDAETFLYGQEIVDHGFADELIESDGDVTAKSDAIVLAKSDFDRCQATMKEDEAVASVDFERAAAYLKTETPTANKTETNNPPATAGKPKVEVQKMAALKELLAANPDAKAEVDALVKSGSDQARAEGETAGKEQMQATIAKAAPYLANADYPTLSTMALKVITGEESVATLTVSVTAIDALSEQMKANLAVGEVGEETPAGHQTAAEKSESEFQARMGNKGGAK